MCHWVALAVEEGGAGGTDGVNHGGGHILAVNDVYGGTARMLSRTVKPLGVETTFLNFEQAGEEGIRKNLRPDTRVRKMTKQNACLGSQIGCLARVPDKPSSHGTSHPTHRKDPRQSTQSTTVARRHHLLVVILLHPLGSQFSGFSALGGRCVVVVDEVLRRTHGHHHGRLGCFP
jgi:hypothetical protein